MLFCVIKNGLSRVSLKNNLFAVCMRRTASGICMLQQNLHLFLGNLFQLFLVFFKESGNARGIIIQNKAWFRYDMDKGDRSFCGTPQFVPVTSDGFSHFAKIHCYKNFFGHDQHLQDFLKI